MICLIRLANGKVAGGIEVDRVVRDQGKTEKFLWKI